MRANNAPKAKIIQVWFGRRAAIKQGDRYPFTIDNHYRKYIKMRHGMARKSRRINRQRRGA